MIQAQNASFSQLVSSQSVTQGATASANFDMVGNDYVTLIFNKGANTNATAGACTISVLSSDNTNATTFATVAANVTQGSSAAVHICHVDWKAQKRYGRVTFTPGTSTGDAVSIGVTAMLTRKEANPSTNSGIATGAVIA